MKTTSQHHRQKANHHFNVDQLKEKMKIDHNGRSEKKRVEELLVQNQNEHKKNILPLRGNK
jgi:hypothetical protein